MASTMIIAYVNADEVNQELAARTAIQHGAVISRVVPEGPLPDGEFDAVLCNLDDVPRGQRFALLEELLVGALHRPTAVHGYDMTEDQIQTLNQRGVAVARRPHYRLLCDLIAAVQERCASAQRDEAGTGPTWVYLPR
jgi:hypothetical protein